MQCKTLELRRLQFVASEIPELPTLARRLLPGRHRLRLWPRQEHHLPRYDGENPVAAITFRFVLSKDSGGIRMLGNRPESIVLGLPLKRHIPSVLFFWIQEFRRELVGNGHRISSLGTDHRENGTTCYTLLSRRKTTKSYPESTKSDIFPCRTFSRLHVMAGSVELRTFCTGRSL